MRGDLNVPVSGGAVTDITRIERLAHTLRELSDKGARVVIISHFGRPKGKVVPEMSLQAVVEPLSRVLQRDPVSFVKDCVGETVQRYVAELEPSRIVLLENLRFHSGEETNDNAFAAQLASLGDFYVNDAFSVCHRAHASTEAITHFLPSVAGRSLEAEWASLESVLDVPVRPVMALIGGAKVSTKLKILGNLMSRVDHIVIGGAMANTFLVAKGYSVGTSIVESALVDTASSILNHARDANCTIDLPSDAVVALKPENKTEVHEVNIANVPNDLMILDIGSKSISRYSALMEKCSTILWNGPLGVFESPPFDRGTVELACRVGELSCSGSLISVAGGGDTIAALSHAGVLKKFSYVSTAGGAFLEWLEGSALPGIVALEVNREM